MTEAGNRAAAQAAFRAACDEVRAKIVRMREDGADERMVRRVSSAGAARIMRRFRLSAEDRSVR